MNQLVENLKLKAWRQAKVEIHESFENAVANRAQDLLIELIIEECCNQVPYGYAETIKEHFGVKQ